MRGNLTKKINFFMALTIILAGLPGLKASGQDPFRGMDDERVLPMLRHLSYEHGGLNVPAVDGRVLFDLVREKGYRKGLEIGTSNGYSGLWLGLAFRETGGKLVTLEIEPARAGEARANFRKAGLDGVIDSRICDALEEIPKLEGTFDFVFIDAWKPDYIRYLELLYDRMEPGGAITAHNVTGQASLMEDFLDRIENDPRLDTRIDRSSSQGISISIVKK